MSKGGVGSNKEENMTQSGTVQYVQGLGKNRPLSIVTTYARNRIEKFFVFWLSYTDDPPIVNYTT